MKDIISGADFFDFELRAVFSGKFEHPVIREEDSQTNPEQKKGDVMGYQFEDINGDKHIVGASHQIEKALTAEGEGVGQYYRITFLGKGTTSSNKPFNKFKVQRYEDETEFKELAKGDLKKEAF